MRDYGKPFKCPVCSAVEARSAFVPRTRWGLHRCACPACKVDLTPRMGMRQEILILGGLFPILFLGEIDTHS